MAVKSGESEKIRFSTGALATALGVSIALFAGALVFVISPVVFAPQPAAPVPARPSSATPTPTPPPPAVTAPLSTRVLFAHQAIGTNLTSGVADVFAAAGLEKPPVADWRKASGGKKPVFAHAVLRDTVDAKAKLDAFARLIGDAPADSLDVALLELSYLDINSETDIASLFKKYTSTMAGLEKRNPDITFLYATVQLTTEDRWVQVPRKEVTGLKNASQPRGADNVARERFNALVRETYAASGRLFDVASEQARLPRDHVAASEHDDHWFFVLNPEISSDGVLLNNAGATQLATELMRLVESLAA